MHPPWIGVPPNPAVVDSRPPALLVKGARPYPEVVKAIKERVDPCEFSDNVHFNKSRNGDLLIRFTNSESIGEEIKKMKSKLSDLDPDVIRNVSTLGRLDSLLILDIDPSITKEELLEALRRITPAKIRDNIKINGLWETRSGYVKAWASVPRGVFTMVRRVKIGFFLCRVQVSVPLHSVATNSMTSVTLPSHVEGPTLAASAEGSRGHNLLGNVPRGRRDVLLVRGGVIPPSRINPAPPNAAPGGKRILDPHPPGIRLIPAKAASVIIIICNFV